MPRAWAMGCASTKSSEWVQVAEDVVECGHVADAATGTPDVGEPVIADRPEVPEGLLQPIAERVFGKVPRVGRGVKADIAGEG